MRYGMLSALVMMALLAGGCPETGTATGGGDGCTITGKHTHQAIDGACVADRDGDGIPDATDNCPTVSNAAQADADGDGDGDSCDACPETAGQSCEGADTDGDGIADEEDNCPDTANNTQVDADGDGVGDECDGCPEDADDACPCPDGMTAVSLSGSVDPGKGSSSAAQIGGLDCGQFQVSGTVSDVGDEADYYLLTLEERSELTLEVNFGDSGCSSGDLELYRDFNSDGTVSDDERLLRVSCSGQSDTERVDPGNYYVAVIAEDPTVQYELYVSAEPLGDMTTDGYTIGDGGETASDASDLGMVETGTSTLVAGVVHLADSKDLYRVQVSEPTSLALAVEFENNGCAQGDVELFFDTNGNGEADNGEQLFRISCSGRSDAQTVDAGTYIISVVAESANAFYELSITANDPE